MLDSCFGLKILGALALPSRLIRGVVEQTEMFPVERHAASRVRNREVWVARASIGQGEGLFVGIVDPSCKQLVGDDDFRFGTHQVPAFRPVNKAVLKEANLACLP